MVVCIVCRAHIDESPHKFGCAVTRRVSDSKLAEVLLKRGLV